MTNLSIDGLAQNAISLARTELPPLQERIESKELTPGMLAHLRGYLQTAVSAVGNFTGLKLPSLDDIESDIETGLDDLELPELPDVAEQPEEAGVDDQLEDIDEDASKISGDLSNGQTPDDLDDLADDVDSLTGSGADLLQADAAWLKEDANDPTAQQFDADALHADLETYQERHAHRS